MKKYVIINCKNAGRTYTKVIEPAGFGKGYKNVIGLGNSATLAEINPNYLETMKNKLLKIDTSLDPKEIKSILIKEIKAKEVIWKRNVGIKYIYDAIDELNIFQSMKKSKRKNQESILKYQIASRVLNNYSIIQSFKSKGKFLNEIDTEKDTFYELLNDLVKNEMPIMKNLNEQIIGKTNRNVQLVFFDSSTVFFESFQREGIKKPGYSKDGKFKEDQVVIGMATDNNGVPIYIDILPGNTADSATMKPFIIKLKQFYNIENITVIADKGMSTNNNLRTLESLGIDYIISQRLKQSSKEFKQFVLNKDEYIQISPDLRYKEMNYESLWKGERPNGVIRKRIITHSISRMRKDRNDRDILINNFYKKANGKNTVSAKEMMGSKKQKFFKEVGNSHFVLDIEKALEDEKYDGFYIYETTRNDLSPSEIIDIYHHQWQIEENFRTLKGQLKVRPVYVRKDTQIKGHFILSFLALVVLKYLLNKINKFIESNGILYKMTNKKFINAINEANIIERYLNNELIGQEEIGFENDNDIKSDYELIKMALNFNK